MQCPDCKSTHIRKNGKKKGKQNHICVKCGRQFIDDYEFQRGDSETVKRECLKMYVNGMGFRAMRANQGSSSHHPNNLGKTCGKTITRCL